MFIIEWMLFINRFGKLQYLLDLLWSNSLSLSTPLVCMSKPFVLEANFDGTGGSISNWRSLLSEIVLTPRFLNDILENFPVLPQKQVGLGKDASVNRALLLLQFLSSSPLAHLPSLLSYSTSKRRAVGWWTPCCQRKQPFRPTAPIWAARTKEK